MADTKRSEFEAERDRLEIAQMYLHGIEQQAITDYLNQTYYSGRPLSRQQISYDIRLIIGRWVRASVSKIDEQKAIELAKINDLELTYRDAWERSKENAEIEVTEQIGTRSKEKPKDGEPQEGIIVPGRIKKYKRTEGQSGNPAFLAGIQWCINKRCELMGLNAPIKHALTDPTGNKEYKPDDSGINRAISTLADALRETVYSPASKEANPVEATEQTTVVSTPEPGG